MIAFPLHRVLSDDPPAAAFKGILFNAPRPLHGDEVACDLTGFTVLVTDDRYRRAETIENNRRLDARVLVWTSRAEALHEARGYIAEEYGQDTADECGDDEDILLDVWAQRLRTGTVEIDPQESPT